jgi:hypothetical protein
MNRGGLVETAFAGRTAPFMLSLDTTWADAADDERCIAWTRRVWSEMHAHSSGGLYLNFGGFGEADFRVPNGASGASTQGYFNALEPCPAKRARVAAGPSPWSGGA